MLTDAMDKLRTEAMTEAANGTSHLGTAPDKKQAHQLVPSMAMHTAALNFMQ